MRSPVTLERLRVQLRAVIECRDNYGLSDAVADRINELEFLIAHETRRAERHATRKPSPWAWLRSVVSGWGFRVEVAGEAGV